MCLCIKIHQNKWPTNIFANLITPYPEQTRKKVFDIFKENETTIDTLTIILERVNFLLRGARLDFEEEGEQRRRRRRRRK